MTHGKDLKEIPHTFDMSVIKGVKFKTKKMRRSTVDCTGSKICSDFQKNDRKVHTRVYEQRKSYFAMNKKANELMPQKMIRRDAA